MYIKEIRINGFKSFADKITLELGKSFTGIVGPNGSGKSNILDAIKWVLGEGSIKNLRGTESIADIIFNGSKNREPSCSASVAIVFDNTDKLIPTPYNEVEVKRVIYKTGENEYFLNKEKCRLKDITELLTDSFSSKESFNIIPQGKIDEILLSRPEGRRVIIEEAASVLKYKKRKETSLRKLSSTHENIERVDMIINELEERITPLKEAAIKAKEYKENKEKLESIDIALVTKDITDYSFTLNEKKQEKEKFEEKLSSTLNESSKDNTLIEKLKLDLINIETKISKLTLELNEKNSLLSSLNTKKELIKERNKYNKDDAEVQTNLISSKEKELKLKVELNKIKLDIDLLETQINEVNELLKKLNNEYTFVSEKIRTNSDKINEAKRKEIEYKNKIDVLENSIRNMEKVPYGVKNILNNPVLGGIINIIGNIIETEEAYNIMLSVALQSSYNFVIVENESFAKEAIEYLKSKALGRVTFLPINVMKPKMVDPETLNKARNAEGYIALASDLVNFDKRFYNIVMNQLGNIIVTKDASSAIKISKIINHKYRVISLTGELMNVGGSITGGSLKINNAINDKYEIIKLENALKILETNIKEYEENNNLINKESDIIRNNIYNKNIELVSLKELMSEKEKQKIEKLESIGLLKDEINTLSSNDISDKELKEVMDTYAKEEENKQKIEYNLETLNKNRTSLKEDIDLKESTIKKSNTSYNELVRSINEIEIELTKSGIKLDNLLNYLNEEYNMTYEKAVQNYELNIMEEEARLIVTDLKRKLKIIGEVNLDSIEEYERVNKRYTFLVSQKEDLIKSENDLLSIIDDMDKVMEKEFVKTFDSINIEFNKVFKELFGGGEAYLKLTDPENILETGIDIIAVPSGKKIKSISQLSGGEKTLTAVSLLFAIMNLKNVPFAILDEIESALDETNVERFGKYLDRYKGKTQLLIITHKKKTMEFVDVLYGITMQESGVSKIVSVNLEEIK